MKRMLKRILVVLLVLILLAVAGFGVLYAGRLRTVNSIEQITAYDDYNLYRMDVKYDYSIDDVINYGGIKISPEEIESIVIKYPLIMDCACVPVKDPLTGQAPKLFIVLSDADAYEPKELKNFLVQNLDASKQPKYIEVIHEIPRTFNGKIQRKKLIELAE